MFWAGCIWGLVVIGEKVRLGGVPGRGGGETFGCFGGCAAPRPRPDVFWPAWPAPVALLLRCERLPQGYGRRRREEVGGGREN